MVNIYPTDMGVSVIMTDLTAQKKSEREMHALVTRLQETNKDLRQFAYIVSHNLRSPIAKVLGLVSLFETDPEIKINNMSLQQCLTEEANNLDNVVKDLNSVISAHDTGKEKKEFTTFEYILKLIERVLDKEIAESKAVITHDFHDPEGITSIHGYLYSIMFNLLSNAIKYRSPNVPLKIHLQTTQDDKFIKLSIKDNGMGINMEKYKDKIFGLYRRFHGNKIAGRGIGLSLVKSQAEAMGGGVTVESQVNVGTTFIISFSKNNTQHATS
jgi:signal transduction histidine kinase